MTDGPAILQVEDSASDALLIQRELRRRWPNARFERVDTALAMRASLAAQRWDAVLSDQLMPGFSAEAALVELRAAGLDVPFLIVSGAIPTETAVDLLRAGAHDFVRKDDLSRLLPALERELAQAEVRRRERWERQERLASEARFRHLVENGADAILIVGPDGLARFGNRRAGGLFGLEAGELVGMAFDLPPLLGENVEMEVASADGRSVCVDVHVTATRWQGEDCHLVNLHDLTARRHAEAQLRELAYLDPLTHLPNRRLLVDRMQQALAQNRRIGQLVAVCYLDLDGFKAVNDTLGHELGDRLLIEVAQRIRGLLRAEDTLARIGGDEFVVLLPCLSGVGQCEQILMRLLKKISAPYESCGLGRHAVSASVGVTLYPEDQGEPEILLRHADQAMYIAKQNGKNCYHLFNTILDRQMVAKRAAFERLRRGFAKGQLCLYFQPKVDFARHAVLGAEALIRWQQPILGLLLPEEFIGIAEDNDMALSIGQWAIREALRQMRVWRREGIDLQVAVNVFARQLQAPDFVQNLRHILAEFPDIPPGRLKIEITESSALPDLNTVRGIIEQCQQIGVDFSLDDFGTGYSSLLHLRHLAAEELKIDQRFVRDMLTDPEAMAIVEGIISLGRAFRRGVMRQMD